MIFITLLEIIEDHSQIITKYGGAHGIRDMGLLVSALEMPKATMFGEYLHPTVFDKAAAYLYHIICNHPFADENKRTGIAAALTFLRQNSVMIRFSEKEMSAFEELIVDTAKGTAKKEQISKFFKDCYRGPEIFGEKQGKILEDSTEKFKK